MEPQSRDYICLCYQVFGARAGYHATYGKPVLRDDISEIAPQRETDALNASLVSQA